MNISKARVMWNAIKGWRWCLMDLLAIADWLMPMVWRMFTYPVVANQMERFIQLRVRLWQTSNNSRIFNSSKSMMSMVIRASD
jgi:hypothetical protein